MDDQLEVQRRENVERTIGQDETTTMDNIVEAADVKTEESALVDEIPSTTTIAYTAQRTLLIGEVAETSTTVLVIAEEGMGVLSSDLGNIANAIGCEESMQANQEFSGRVENERAEGNEDEQESGAEEQEGANEEEDESVDDESSSSRKPREKRTPNVVFTVEMLPSTVFSSGNSTSSSLSLANDDSIRSSPAPENQSSGSSSDTTTQMLCDPTSLIIRSLVNSWEGLIWSEDSLEKDLMESLEDRFREFLAHVRSVAGHEKSISEWRLECFHRKGTSRTMDCYFIKDGKRFRSKDHFVKEHREQQAALRRMARAAARKQTAPEKRTSEPSSPPVKRKGSKRLAALKKKQELSSVEKRITRAKTKAAEPPKKKTRVPSAIDRFADLVRDGKRILIILGAGVSTAAGLPDFRTKSTGLYSAIASGKLGKDALPAELLFHAETFEQDPVPFYDFASKTFMPLLEAAKPTLTHQFVKLLMDHDKLLRCYTQNVDGLEKSAGVTDKYLVHCHGTLRSGRCLRCRARNAEPFWWQAKAAGGNKGIPECNRAGCKGDLRPDMIFFGEEVPALIEYRLEHDVKKCDLVVVMGTSLSVRPVSEILTLVPEDVPRVWINRTMPPDDVEFTVAQQGDCDEAVGRVARRLRWL